MFHLQLTLDGGGKSTIFSIQGVGAVLLFLSLKKYYNLPFQNVAFIY